MNNKYILGTIGVVIIGAILFLFVTREKTPSPTVKEGAPVTQVIPTKTPVLGTTPAPAVIYTNEGFSPLDLTVKKGTMVTFINQSDSLMWVASGPHPAHTLYPEFDEKTPVGKGSSYSFTFEKIGNHPYHNHLNAGNKGKIIVE